MDTINPLRDEIIPIPITVYFHNDIPDHEVGYSY